MAVDARFMANVGAVFAAMKAAPSGSVFVPIPGTGERLVPVGKDAVEAPDLIPMLARWRSENLRGFPRWVAVGGEETRVWARRQLIEREDRLLFLIIDATGTPVGNIGLSSFDQQSRDCELDNVIRGDKRARPGIMRDAGRALLDWAFRDLNLAGMWVECFFDNFPAVRLYHRLGFVPVRLCPIRQVPAEGGSEWVRVAEDAGYDGFMIRMARGRPE